MVYMNCYIKKTDCVLTLLGSDSVLSSETNFWKASQIIQKYIKDKVKRVNHCHVTNLSNQIVFKPVWCILIHYDTNVISFTFTHLIIMEIFVNIFIEECLQLGNINVKCLQILRT